MADRVKKGPYSSLVDSVKPRIRLEHPPIAVMRARAGSGIIHSGKRNKVRSAFPGVHAFIYSEQGNYLVIEGSVPRFLTGQNVVGREDFLGQIVEFIDAVLERAAITPTEEERQRYHSGNFDLLRVDFAAHVDCRSKVNAANFMWALREGAAGHVQGYSAYDAQTVYWGEHSPRRTLKGYAKGIQLDHQPLSERVYGREKLKRLADRLVRFEFTLRADELKRLNLRSPLNWNPSVARRLLQDMIIKYVRLKGKVPNVDLIDELTPSVRDRLELFLRGAHDAFSRYPNSDAHRQVLKITGIDVRTTFTPAKQKLYLLTMRDLFDTGFRFRSWASAWTKLKGGSQGG